jgi:putative spermidine/putrescine transport system permease protein
MAAPAIAGRGGGSKLLFAAAVPILLFLIIPTLIVIPMALTSRDLIEFPPSGISTRTFSELAADTRYVAAAITSLKVALVAILISTITGTTAAVALHGARFPGKGLVIGLILAPIVLPLIVLGLATYRAFAPLGLVGNWAGIALAHSVLATPYVFMTVQASLTGVDPSLIRSARSLGAGGWSVARHVYLPALLPGIGAGALLALVVSMDEVVVAFFLQGPDAVTLPVRMFLDIQWELSPKIAAVASLLVGAASVVLLIQTVLVLRRRGAAQAERTIRAR